MAAPAQRKIHLTIDIEGAEPVSHLADGYQSAADWLLEELGRNTGSPYPPVGNEAELADLVEAMNDKLGTSGVDVGWTYVD